MNSKQLEMISVSHLKLKLMSTDYLDPAINEGDKEPSWDGFVYVHDNKEHRKKDIGKVPVQVKGTHRDHFPLLNEIKYQAEVIDLQNYLADGGAIYFVVYIKSYTESIIFYAQLDPIKLKGILGEKTKGKTNITLKKLPDESFDIVNIFRNFLYNRTKQMSFRDKPIYTLDTITDKSKEIKLGFTLSGLGLKEENLQKFIDYNNVYIYADSPNFPIPIPLMGQLKELIRIEEDNKLISINDKVFYTKQTREHNRDIITLRFGDSFEIITNKNTLTFNYNVKDNVRILVKDLEFLILMFENNGFDINDHFIDMTNVLKQDKSFDLEKNKKFLREYQEIVEFMNYLNLDGDLDLSKLTSAEFRDIATLKKALVDKEEVVLKEDMSVTTCIKIQDYSIALAFYLKENETDLYTVEDLFKVEESIIFSKNTETNIQTTVPMFRVMGADDLAKSSNIHFESLIGKYKILRDEPGILSDANLFVLQLILAADLCTENKIKRNNFLEISLTFINWLQAENRDSGELPSSTLRLNELQIFKRLRPLSQSEREDLVEISDSSKSPNEIKFGAYVLLNDKIRANNYLKKLSHKENKNIKGYPIYNLFKLL